MVHYRRSLINPLRELLIIYRMLIHLPDGTIQTYSDKDLQLLEKHIPKAEVITMHTLTSLLDYIKGNIDTMS